MPRPPRADEAGGLYHALNRGNLRADIFKKEGDFAAFEKILFEGLQLHQIELFSYQVMSNHYQSKRLRDDSILNQPCVPEDVNEFDRCPKTPSTRAEYFCLP